MNGGDGLFVKQPLSFAGGQVCDAPIAAMRVLWPGLLGSMVRITSFVHNTMMGSAAEQRRRPVTGSVTGHRSLSHSGRWWPSPRRRDASCWRWSQSEDWASPDQPTDVVGTIAQVASAGIRSLPHAWQLTAYAGVRCPARA